jgi:hypothetical protein
MNYLDRNGYPTMRLKGNDCGLSYARNWLLDMERQKKCKTSSTSSKCTPSSNMISKEDHEKLMLEQKNKYLKEIERIQREKNAENKINPPPKKENKPITTTTKSTTINKFEPVDIKDDAISFLLEVYLSGVNQKFEEDKFRELFFQPISTIKITTDNIKDSVHYIDKIIRYQKNVESHVISFEQFIYIVRKKVAFNVTIPGNYPGNIHRKLNDILDSWMVTFKLFIGGEDTDYMINYNFDKLLKSLEKF